MKLSKLIFCTLASSLISLSTFASVGTSSGGGLGPMAFYTTCTGSLKKTYVSFEVRSTALPNFIDSVLIAQPSNVLLSQLKCVHGGNVAPGAPSAGQMTWVCNEFRPENAKGISVEIMRGGVTGMMTGEIKQAQKYPNPPKVIGTLLCK